MNNNKVVLIGCGNVGLSYAFSLVNSNIDVSELVMIDLNKEKLEGSVLDLSHSAIALGKDMKIRIGKYSDCSDAKIVCITAGMSQANLTSRINDLEKTNSIISSIVNEVKNSGFSGIYLIASNPLDLMTYMAWKCSGLDSSKVIGTGTLLETARLKYYISQKLGIAPSKIEGYVFGEHGDTQFIVWSSVIIDGKPASDVLSQDDMNEISDLTRKAGYEIAQKVGSTNYGIGNCLEKLTKIILDNNTTILPICCYHKDNDVYITSLAKINSTGVVDLIDVPLNNDEQKKFDDSVAFLKQFI